MGEVGEAENRPSSVSAGNSVVVKDSHVEGSVTNCSIVVNIGQPSALPTVSLVPPRQLFARPDPFVNRTAELQRLTDAVTAAHEDATVLAVVRGPRGIGKTATISAWTHAIVESGARRVRDGVIMVRLSEYRTGSGFADLAGLAARLLRDIRVPESEIAALRGDHDALFSTWRSEASRRHLLLVLDDVDKVAQLHQLLPSRRCTMVVASATDLWDVDLPEPVDVALGVLEPGAARELLLRPLRSGGPEQPTGDELAPLLELCGGHPLALRACGATLRRSGLSPAELAGDLGVSDDPIAELGSTGDTTLSAALREHYATLTGAQQMIYRRLGQHPGLDYDLSSAAAVCGVPERQVRRLLGEMAQDGLTTCSGARWAFHPLLRAHAVSFGRHDRANDPETARALDRRLVTHYLAAARDLDRVAAHPTRFRLVEQDQDSPPPRFVTRRAAFDWFVGEHQVFPEVLSRAQDCGMHTEAWMLCEALWPGYDSYRSCPEMVEVFALGVEAARADGDVDAVARTATMLVRAAVHAGDLAAATAAEPELLEVARNATHPKSLPSALESVGVLRGAIGDVAGAVAAFGEARRIFVERNATRGAMIQDYLLAKVYARTGRHDRVVELLAPARQALHPGLDTVLRARTLLLSARSLGALDRTEEASSVLHEVLVLSDDGLPAEVRVTAHELLADLAERAGDLHGAAGELAEVIQIHAGNQEQAPLRVITRLELLRRRAG